MSNNKGKIKKTSKILLLSILYLTIIFFSAITIFTISCYLECKAIKVSAENKVNKYNITYDNGELIKTTQNNIKIEDLNELTINAFISIEDKSFYNHKGYNLKRIAKATLTNLKNFSIKEGASTITQQLIKNKYLTQDKTFKRKIKEIFLAKKLEEQFNKNQILENYLNTIYFGHGCYGIENASNYYFNKKAKDLTLSENCILAAIIKAPAYYSPIKNPEKCLARRNLILKEMLEDNFISEKEYTEAKSELLILNISNNPSTTNQENNLIDYIFSYAEKILSIDKEDIIKNNYKITTTLNKNYQKNLSIAVLNKEFYKENSNGYIADGLGIIIENNSNKILAFCSNSDYNVYSAKRQPGSAIKPILVYAPAFEYGIANPNTKILDEPITIKNYKPQNLGNKYYGYIPVKDCVAKSLNIPAIKIMEKTGIDRSKKFAQKLGIKFSKYDTNYAIALGGFTNGVELKDLANAYTSFANNGYYKDCYIIDEIRNSDGILLYKNSTQQIKMINEATSYLTTTTLKESVKNGTSKKLNELNYDIAGKTGTVCVKNSNLNTDSISIAYTTDITAGVWLGNYTYDKNKMLEGNNNGGTYATDILKNIFNNIYSDTKPNTFIKPANIVTKNIDAYEYEYNNNIYTSESSNTITMEFDKKYLPPEKTIKTINLDEIIKWEMTDDKLIIKIPIHYNINLQLKNLKSQEQINPIKTHKSNNYFEFIFNNLNDGKYEIVVKNKQIKSNISYLLKNNTIYIDKKLN